MLLKDDWHDPRSSTVLWQCSSLRFCIFVHKEQSDDLTLDTDKARQIHNGGSKLFISLQREPKKTFTNHSQADYCQSCWMKKSILRNLSDKVKEAKRFQKQHIMWFTKITPTVHWQLIWEVTEQPKTTCKELQTSLASCSLFNSKKETGQQGTHWKAV